MIETELTNRVSEGNGYVIERVDVERKLRTFHHNCQWYLNSLLYRQNNHLFIFMFKLKSAYTEARFGDKYHFTAQEFLDFVHGMLNFNFILEFLVTKIEFLFQKQVLKLIKSATSALYSSSIGFLASSGSILMQQLRVSFDQLV